MVSHRDTCKRALVSLLRILATLYGCCVGVTRESLDCDVRKAYRTVSKKVHPDKGGNAEDQKRLNVTYREWCDAAFDTKAPKAKGTAKKGKNGEPQAPVVAATAGGRKTFEFRSQAVLLTYQGFEADPTTALDQWVRFKAFVAGSLRLWGATRWTATLETNADGKHHAHLMVQFTSQRHRAVSSFCFEGLRPHAAANDVLGEGFSKKRWQSSCDRGHFYCWANKRGTMRDLCGDLCVGGNYSPAWTGKPCNYPVLGAWPEKLWKAYKLDDEVYWEYLHLCRDGLPGRKRNFHEHTAWKKKRDFDAEVAARIQRIRNNPLLYTPFSAVPEAAEWLNLFQTDALRYPVLLVHGPSRCGKTEWAESLFKCALVLKVGVLTQFPEGARQLDRGRHDGVVLDDVRDLEFLSDHQDKLQGKYSGAVELGTTPSGQYAFFVDFFRLPVVATVNNSTQNLGFLTDHDFVANRDNVRLLSFTGRPGEVPPTDYLACQTTFL